MKKRTYLSAGLALLIGTLSVHASPGLSDIKSRVLPAVYKSKNGLDWESVGEGKRGDIGGRRIIKKEKK